MPLISMQLTKSNKNYGKIYEWLIFLHFHHGWEGISFMLKINFEIFIKSLRFATPWVRKSGVYKSVCVCLSFAFFKKSKIPVLVFDSAHKSLLIIPILFFD